MFKSLWSGLVNKRRFPARTNTLRSRKPPCGIRPYLERLEDRIAPVTGLTPFQIRQFYEINAIGHFGAQPADGTGETIAIVDTYNDPNIFQDVDSFDQTFSLTANTPSPINPSILAQYGGAGSFLHVFNENSMDITNSVANNNGTNGVPVDAPLGSGAAVETALDVEWAHAIAPGATIDLVEVPPDGEEQNLFAGVQTASLLPGVSVVSMSWVPENWGNNPSFQTTGVTYVAASGDGGVDGLSAIESNVLAVGGTVINSDNNGNLATESAWVDSGGGPVAGLVPEDTNTDGTEGEPGYQSAEAARQNTGDRLVPDVAFDAGTAVAMYDSYDNPPPNPPANSQTSAIGTSVSTPCWAGLIAIANQGRAYYGQPALNTSGPQQAMDLLYGLPAADFNKITGGSNAQITGISDPNDTHVYTETQVTFDGGGPNGGNPAQPAQADVQTGDGAITGFWFGTGGNGYQSSPSVDISGDGSLTWTNANGSMTTAQFTAVIANGSVTGVQVSLNGGPSQPFPTSLNAPLVPAQNGIGAGYLSIDFSGGDPTNGQEPIAIPQVNSSGQITGAQVINPFGAGGFRAAPTATIDDMNGVTTLPDNDVLVDYVPATDTGAWSLSIASGQSYNQATGLGTPIANRLIPGLLGGGSNVYGIGPITSLAPATSDHGLALSPVNNQEFVAWRDSHQFLNIMPINADGTGDFADQFTAPYTVNSSPALATLNGQLYVAWVGENDNYQIFLSLVNLNGDTISVSPPMPILGVNTNNYGSPALAAFNGNLYLAYTGSGGDLMNVDRLTNTNGQLVPDGNDITITEGLPQVKGLTVQGSPALAASGGKLFIAWAGRTNNNQLFDAQVTDNGTLLSVVDGVPLPYNSDKWSSPGLADLHGTPVLAFIGRYNHYVFAIKLDSNGNPVASDPDPGYVANNGNMFDQLNGGPALGSINGNVLVAWTNVTQDFEDNPVDFSPFAALPLAEANKHSLTLSENSQMLQESPGGTPPNSFAIGTFNQIQVLGQGDDQLTLDFSKGNFIPAGGLTFDGGPGGPSTLILENGSFTDEVITPSGPNSGTISLDGSTISYSDVSAIIDTDTVTNLTVNGTDSAGEQVNFINDPNGSENGIPTEEINSGSGTFTKIDFGNKAYVTFQGGIGGDTYTLNITKAAAQLSTLTVTGASSTGDTFNVQATCLDVGFAIATASSGTSTVNLAPAGESLASLAGALTLDGGIGGTTYLVADDQKDPNSQTYYLTSSSFWSSNSATVNYSNLAATTLNGGTGASNWLAILDGRSGGETWTIAAGTQAGSLQVQGTAADGTPVPGTPITATGLNTLSIDTTLSAKQTPLFRLAGNTYVVDDLSTTGIKNVDLDIYESQSATPGPDTITVDGAGGGRGGHGGRQA